MLVVTVPPAAFRGLEANLGQTDRLVEGPDERAQGLAVIDAAAVDEREFGRVRIEELLRPGTMRVPGL